MCVCGKSVNTILCLHTHIIKVLRKPSVKGSRCLRSTIVQILNLISEARDMIQLLVIKAILMFRHYNFRRTQSPHRHLLFIFSLSVNCMNWLLNGVMSINCSLRIRHNSDLTALSHWEASGVILICLFVFSTHNMCFLWPMFYLVHFVRRENHLSTNRIQCSGFTVPNLIQI